MNLEKGHDLAIRGSMAPAIAAMFSAGFLEGHILKIGGIIHRHFRQEPRAFDLHGYR